MKSITYSIPNISCKHCLAHINEGLSELQGVEEVLGDLNAKKVTVEFSDPANDTQIREKLTEIGYPAE